RGYIMQGIAFFSKNKWLSILLSSIIFGMVHGTNPEVAKYGFWTMQFYYILAGVFLALITVLDDGLELALGVHAATNIFGATLFTYEGSVLQTDSLFIISEINPWQLIVAFVVACTFFIFICFRKFHWPSLSSLFLPLEKEVDIVLE
ncbi:MAG: CPBP family intramembrane metalloprotease, partial [Saprospiraceae bacterium]|nr:CPBP family intramembrane metalloprotease [Saprospiraceae bacterium]